MQKKSALTNEEKMKIALESKNSRTLTQKQIADKYNISQSQVSRWVSQFSKLGWKLPKKVDKKKYLPGAGRKSIYSVAIQEEIVSLVSDLRFHNYPVTVRRIMIHLKTQGMIDCSVRDKNAAQRIRRLLRKNGIDW